jgi:predicted ATPase
VALAQPLAQLVQQKTQGNPFFASQFLQELQAEGHLVFDPDAGHWQCDLTRVRQLALTEDVVVFMVGRLRKLPAGAQAVLRLAACLGNRFDLATLAVVCDQDPVAVAVDLWRSLQAGLILPENDTYKFFQGGPEERAIGDGLGDGLGNGLGNGITVAYRFLHDRVQQAAYTLITPDQRPATHLQIGQRLLSNSPHRSSRSSSRGVGQGTGLTVQPIQPNLLDMVNHLNRGRTLLTQPPQRLELAHLNLEAGQTAQAGTAYHAAFDYFSLGLTFLPEDAWTHHYDLTLALHRGGAIVAHLIGEFETMAQWINVALVQVADLLAQIPFYETQIQALGSQQQPAQAIELGLEILARLGAAFPAQPKPEDLAQGMASINISLAGREIESLIDLPPMTDAQAIAILKILWRLSSLLVIAAPQLMPFCMFKGVELSIAAGNSVLSAPVYATYGMILCGAVGDMVTGYRFGQLALDVLDRYNGKVVYAKTLVRFTTGVRHWQDPLQDTLSSLAQGYQLGLEVGDWESAAICAAGYGYHSYFAGQELSQLERELGVYSQGIAAIGQGTVLRWNNIYRQMVLNLLGRSEDPARLVGSAYDETVDLPQQRQHQDGVGMAIAYIFQGMACYWFQQPDQAIVQFQNAISYGKRLAAFAHTPPLFLPRPEPLCPPGHR